MSNKITLDNVSSGYDLSKINANFQTIQDELNNRVLYRNVEEGETNTLEDSLDANSKSIYNLSSLNVQTLRVGGALVTPDNVVSAPFPSPEGQSGKILASDGIESYWDDAENISSIQSVISALDASQIAYTANGVNSVTTNVSDKLNEIISVADKGAVAGINCASAILDAAQSTTGSILIPAGDFVATATTGISKDILSVLNRIRCDGTLTINLDSGEHPFTEQIIINSPDAHKIRILGAATVNTTATSQLSVSGTSKAYSVTLGLASSSGISEGDYALIRTNVTGTGDYHSHCGIWRITAVNSGGLNRITLLNTHHGATFPTNTLSGGSVVIIKTVLKFTGCDGFRFEGGQPLGFLNKVVIVGDWNVSSGTGTSGAHGIITSAPIITGGASSNAVFNMTGSCTIGETVGISSWGEQGVALSGRGTMVANFIASCSNRKRGIYSEGSSLRVKYAICSGNGEDGFISDTTGFIQAAYGVACGNGLNGFWSTNHSFINASNSVSSGNLSNGFEARGMARLAADAATSKDNTNSGFSASDGAMIDADASSSTNNGISGYVATGGSIIDCDNSISTLNTGYGYRSEYGSVIRCGGSTVSGNTISNYYSRNNSILIESAGGVNPNDIGSYEVSPRFYNPNKQNYFSPIVTSIGDMVWSTGTSRFVMKADGVFYPSADNTQTLGRSSERWSVVYAGTGTINTSDAREKQQVTQLSISEKAVATRLKSLIRSFKFNDAVLEKGNEARIHIGLIAQEVKSAFESEGLDAEKYAILCYDEWPEQPEIINDDGCIIQHYYPAGNRYGLRYDQLVLFIISSL